MQRWRSNHLMVAEASSQQEQITSMHVKVAGMHLSPGCSSPNGAAALQSYSYNTASLKPTLTPFAGQKQANPIRVAAYPPNGLCSKPTGSEDDLPMQQQHAVQTATVHHTTAP
jgi:hypothetical protein